MLENNILSQGLDLLREKQRLSEASYNDMKLYLTKVDKSQYKEVKYKDFNKVNSITLVFDDFNRTVTNDGLTNLSLFTNVLSMQNTIIKGIVFDDEVKRNVSFSTDGVNYLKLTTFNASELINTIGLYLKVEVKPDEVIKSFYVIYDLV